ncbi:MAG: hypothetical protein ACJAU0_002251 [Flavobacteriales bacterium]|jgi:hypothetical protein
MVKTEIDDYKVLWYDCKVVVGGVALVRSFAVGKGLILFLYNSDVIKGSGN